MRYTIVTSIPDDELAARWNAFLPGARFATHYVTPAYFTDPYVNGERFAILAHFRNDDIAAVLTGTRSDKRIMSGMFSRPQLAFPRKVNKKKAIAALASGLKELGSDSVLTEVYTWEPVELHLYGMRARQSSEETSIVMLDLSTGVDAIFAGFSQTRRNEIRRAEKKKLIEVKELETDAELIELYQIYCGWNERKGNTPDSIEKMKIAAGQPENRRVLIAKADGRVIAGSFYRFCPGGVVEYAANFSLPEYQSLRPNDLIGWRAIQWACSAGFSHFSMGGAHMFLRRFGGEVVTTYRYRHDPSLFRLHDLREGFELGIGALQLLPDNLRSGVRRILAK